MVGRYGMELRGLEEADAPGLAALMAAAGLPAEPRALAGRIAALRRQPGVALLAQEWGPPSGVIAAHWAHGLQADAPQATLDLLLVDPESRRRGVGRLLLKAAAQAARQAGCATLGVAVAEARADLLAFCRGTGFDPAGGALVRPLRRRG